MKRVLALFAVLAVAVVVSGCYETQTVYVVNPDGSGKAVLTAKFQGGMGFDMGAAKKTPEDKTKDAVVKLLEKSEGIEAWSNVSATTLDDGRIDFKGTAYFKDISKIKFHNLGDTKVTLVKAPGGDATLTVKFGKEEEKKSATAPANMTEEQIVAGVKAAKMGYQQAKPMMAGILATMKTDVLVLAPGTVKSKSNINQLPNGALRVTFDGAKVLAVMDKMMLDEAWLREQVKAGRDPMKEGPAGDNAMNKLVFGEDGPVQAVLGAPLKARFDYATEVAAAKTAYKAILKKYGAAAPIPVAQASQGGALKKVSVAGVQLVRSADMKKGIQPLNEHQPSYKVSLIAELPGSAISISEARILTAIADTGQDLRPERDWDRKAHFPKLSKDKASAIVNFKLEVPEENVKGLKELSGTIEYISATGTKKTDLGIKDFTAGSTGAELGATIKSLEVGKWTKKPTLALKLGVPSTTVKEIEFYGADGTRLECERAGSMSSGNTYTPSFTMKDGGAFPTGGRIVVEVYDNQQKFTAPFKIENVNLLGMPM